MAENINKTEQENNSLSIEKDKSSTETKTLLKNVEKKEISPEELLKRAGIIGENIDMSIFKEEFLLENSSSFGSGDKFIKSSTTKLLERNIFKNMQIDDFFEPLINNKYTKIQEKSLKRKKYFQEIEHILSSQIINFIKATTNQNTDNIKSITFSKSSIKILFDDNMEENFEIIINEEGKLDIERFKKKCNFNPNTGIVEINGEKTTYSEIMKMKEKNKETFQILSEILDIWLKTATSRIQGWQSKKEKNEAEQYLKEIQKNHGELEQYEFFEKDLGIFNSKIKYIFSIIQYIENNSRSLYGFEGIIGIDDMKKVEETLFSKNKSKNEKLLEIFHQMRESKTWYGYMDRGGSKNVSSHLANHLLEEEKFGSEKQKLEMFFNEYAEIGEGKLKFKKDIDKINENDLFKIFGDRKFAKKLLTKLKSIKSQIEKAVKGKGVTKEEIDNGVFSAFYEYIKHTLLRNKIVKLPWKERGNSKNSYKGMYANLNGLTTNDYYSPDWVIVADERQNWSVDLGVNIIITAGLVLGAVYTGGTTLSGLGVVAGRMGATSFAANIASKTGLAYGVSSAVVNGVVFHVGMNTFHNLNHGEIFDENGNINWKKVGEGNLNVKELAKSIVFMGMLHGFNSSFIRGIGEKIKNGVPGGKYLFFSEILIETCSLIGISIGTELVFGEDYKEILSSLTPEEFFKLLALIIVMKQMDKGLKTIKLKKNNDGSIDIGEMEKI